MKENNPLEYNLVSINKVRKGERKFGRRIKQVSLTCQEYGSLDLRLRYKRFNIVVIYEKLSVDCGFNSIFVN